MQIVDAGVGHCILHGYTARHLHQRISKNYYSAIGKHLITKRGLDKKEPIDHLSKVVKKCTSNFDLIYEMLFIKDINPSLNTQTDSTRAERFT